MRSGRRKLVAGVALAVALGVGTVGVVVGASDTTFEGNATSEPRGSYDHGPGRDHPQRPPGEKPCPDPIGHTVPAEIVGTHGVTTVSSNILLPVNGWMAGDCRLVTWVWAGESGMHRGTGRFVIERYPGPRRDVWLDVPDSGALRITRSPDGPKAITWAQRRGELEFTGERGITGTFHLRDYTVTASTGQVIEPLAGRR